MSKSKTSNSSKRLEPFAAQIHVVSAPSGAGKTTLTRQLIETLPSCVLSVSYTTREPRTHEVNGRDYHFVSQADFQKMVRQKQFLEYARVHDHFYGTHLQQVLSFCEKGLDVLLDIDVQGGRSIRKKVSRANLVFILPPSMDVLRDRLLRRGTESDQALEVRLRNAAKEMQQVSFYDHLIINDELEPAVEEMKMVILASRLKVKRRLYTSGENRFPIFQMLKVRRMSGKRTSSF